MSAGVDIPRTVFAAVTPRQLSEGSLAAANAFGNPVSAYKRTDTNS